MKKSRGEDGVSTVTAVAHCDGEDGGSILKHKEAKENTATGQAGNAADGTSEPRRKCPFIAIHLGAGDHSMRYKERYEKVCNTACLKAMKILRSGGTSGQAVAEAIKVLEDCSILNAGCGSSLTIDGTVECDAGFMDGEGYYGGAGAVPGVPNPILVAQAIANVHKELKLLPHGRVPPNLMVGQAARNWAEAQGIPVCDEKKLVSKGSEKQYQRYLKKMEAARSAVNDTVGAIALDNYGHVAAGVSSGGNWLKLPGRIGHSPLFGCGCWSSNASAWSSNAIALSSTGSGEQLSRIRLPQECAYDANSETSTGLVASLSSCIQKHMLNNRSLNVHEETRHVGLIALLWDGCRGEFAYGHTSNTLVVAYCSGNMKEAKMKFSLLNDPSKPTPAGIPQPLVEGRAVKVVGHRIGP